MQRVISNLNVRVDKIEKENASAKLRSFGMDMSTAINIFLRQINIQNEFPLRIYSAVFPQSLYDELDYIAANRDINDYVPAEQMLAEMNDIINEVENGEF